MTNKLIKKVSTTVVSIATVVSLSGGALLPATVLGATTAELQAQINALLASVAALQAQLGSATPATSGASATLLASGDLTLGSKGAAVKELQMFLNANGAQVAASGAGSSGSETMTFGSLTKAALAKWQAANGVSPAAGYFGAKTRAKMSITAAAPAPAGGPAPVSTETSLPAPIPAPEVAVVVSAPTTTPAVTLSNPFESSLKIEFTLNPSTLSSYGEKVLTEFRLSANEKIGINRIRFKNSGTFADAHIVGLKLINSATNEVLAKVDSPVSKYIEFTMDKVLAVSGDTYYVSGILLTPIYGAEKPYIRLDIISASDVSAFDFNDLNRVADISKTNTFPIEGAKISAF